MHLADIMSHAGLAGFAEVALVLFLIAFAVILFDTFRPSSRKALDAASRLPFDDDSTGQPKEDSRS